MLQPICRPTESFKRSGEESGFVLLGGFLFPLFSPSLFFFILIKAKEETIKAAQLNIWKTGQARVTVVDATLTPLPCSVLHVCDHMLFLRYSITPCGFFPLTLDTHDISLQKSTLLPTQHITF